MMEHTLPLITFYQGWGTHQQGLVETIAPLSSEQLALPAASHHWTIGMVAQHIAANRVWMFHVWMGEGSSDLAPIAHWDPADHEYQPPRDGAELVAGLKSTWSMIAESLSRWTAADLGHILLPPPSLGEYWKSVFPEPTRQWIIWHVLEHEIHHGGELSLALGGLSLPGVYGNAINARFNLTENGR